MNELGTYSFLPWLRQGLANRIQADDLDPSVKTRASVALKLKLSGDRVGGGSKLEKDIDRNVALYGPGDIVGIEGRAIVKVEPRNWITNFESTYLPYIEFYDEDFPWRYTPAAPGGAGDNRLRPWIMLVVLREDEFEEVSNVRNRPLPLIEVADGSVFPPSDKLWAWAHVHVNQSVIDGAGVVVESNANAPVLARFETILRQNPDLAYSRIVSPRKLAENTDYHAFLVPVFETGRLAGLGLDPSGAPFATFCAWDAYPSGSKPEPTHYPVYHRWYFRTGSLGDFEYLVRLLEPRPMDRRVGRRDMDVQNPGSNLPGITDPDLGGVLKLGGALQIPVDTLKPADKQEVQKYENWDQPYPHAFQEQLAAFVNLADDYAEKDPQTAKVNPNLPDQIRNDPDPDPVITPPIYGRWHAKVRRLLRAADGSFVPRNRNWVHELNLDPRFRVAAGFGTDVVKTNQEAYMDAAWEQIGDVLRANQQIRWAQLAREVSDVWYGKHLEPLKATNPDRFLVLTAPVDKRILFEGATRFHTVKNSRVPRAVLSAPLRRVLRPRARLLTRLEFPAGVRPEALASRINRGEVQAAPPKEVPAALPTPDDIAEQMEPDAPELVKRLTRSAPWLRFLFLGLGVAVLLLLVLFLGPSLGAIDPTTLSLGSLGLFLAALFFYLFRYLSRIGREVAEADSVREENQTPESVARLPPSPDFEISRAGSAFEPSPGGSDSGDAARFKQALRDNFVLIQASREAAAEPARTTLDLPRLVDGTFRALDPSVTVRSRTFATVYIPPRIKDALDDFEEAMAYPELDLPTYMPLVGISADLFLPNIQFVEQNSISLLETNQRFIEAYMVGLNHEFGRELLWREYPTDQRGSYFRQFWDVSSYLDRDGSDDDALREKLRDIPPLHRWSRSSDLGDHDHREMPGESEEELVLVIRGELLKKYPTAVIYAHRAEWQLGTDGEIDKTKPRKMVELSGGEVENPPEAKVRTPLYEAKVDPDIYFFGFDLTAREAKGESDDQPEDAGWFFVIKERPGEPRFGFDIDQDGSGGGTKSYWNDLSWEDVLPGGAPGDFLQPTPAPSITLTAPPASATDDQKTQHAEDLQVAWTNQVSAADLAYIMYQVPVLVAVHASEMLPD